MDAAVKAVAVGCPNGGGRPIRFLAADAHRMPFPDDSFDVVLLQSVLHHDDCPAQMIEEAFRVGRTVVIHEPNGNNLGLKVIEKVSPYHIAHGEKSYTTGQVKRWIEAAGGRVVHEKAAGFVPMFCPNWMAKAMKFVEPALESTPVLGSLMCAVYVLVGARE
jgi:SAM-dependent methyltransferase